MANLQLLLKDQKRQASLELIIQQPTFKDALKLCRSLSGLSDKEIAEKLKMKTSQFSKILYSDSNFPIDNIIDFMRICENIVPLIWLTYKCGYTLKPLKSELEAESEFLKREIEEREQELQFKKEILKEAFITAIKERRVAKEDLENLGIKINNF